MAELSLSDGNSQHSGDSDDQDFDPSAEMMIFEHDDERTLDDEEAISNSESVTQELSQLEHEKDMPLEQILTMYGYGTRAVPSRLPSFGDGILGSEDLTLDKDEIARDLLQHTDHDRETSVHDLLNSVDIGASSQTIRLLRAGDHHQQQMLSFDEEEEEEETSSSGASSDDDNEYITSPDTHDLQDESRHDDWRKTIQIGVEHQAELPECITRGDGVESNGAESAVDIQMWDPTRLPESEVTRYLHQCYQIRQQQLNSKTMLESYSESDDNIYEDEVALQNLHEQSYCVSDALERWRSAPSTSGPFSQWSEEECRNFESGLLVHSKNFFLIQQNKVPTRTVCDLVLFYYLWKKTERHDSFVSKYRVEKKKYALHPGITDYMERFLDEAENVSSASQGGSRLVDRFAVASPGGLRLPQRIGGPVDDAVQQQDASDDASITTAPLVSSVAESLLPLLADSSVILSESVDVSGGDVLATSNFDCDIATLIQPLGGGADDDAFGSHVVSSAIADGDVLQHSSLLSAVDDSLAILHSSPSNDCDASAQVSSSYNGLTAVSSDNFVSSSMSGLKRPLDGDSVSLDQKRTRLEDERSTADATISDSSALSVTSSSELFTNGSQSVSAASSDWTFMQS